VSNVRDVADRAASPAVGLADPFPRGRDDEHPETPAQWLHQTFEASCDATPTAVAVECEGHSITYDQLDRRANQLAHALRKRGIRTGCRVGILLRRSVAMYVALLATAKTGAAYVPIHPGSPPDRVAYIVEDSDVDLLLTSSELADVMPESNRAVLPLDECDAMLAEMPTHRLELDDNLHADPSAYVIYTSGSSGRPKGVEVAQSSICNYLSVIPGVYGVGPDDRVYQGMTIAFDFSIEEIWMTWTVGATVVAAPAEGWSGLGVELTDFLDESGVTVLCCVPTLLATIPGDLPHVRILVVGGEACPAALVQRWSRPGRRMLNTYGPTETTITATYCELLPERPVTIGRPLPTYSAVLLDDEQRVVPDGEVGEICIGGPGVARGYVGRPELTAKKFIEHPLAPRGTRLYRTGDLGRITPGGEIEYLGRADAEVKIRGHRVDLGEIDNVLMEEPEAAEAVVNLMPTSDHRDAPQELAAYVVPAPECTDNDELVRRLHERARCRLPAYMVPSFLDVVSELPTMASGKVDRRQLPVPQRRLAGTDKPVVPAETEAQRRVRAAWAEVLGVEPESLSVEADFFRDLGGHSLLAARAVSCLRADGLSAAVRDLYANPTIRALAACLDDTARRPDSAGPSRRQPLRHSSRRILGAGSAQAAILFLLLGIGTFPLSYVYSHVSGPFSIGFEMRIVAAVWASYLVIRWLLPLILVRPLGQGIRPGRYRLWGRTYLRLWALDLVLGLSPLPLLSGSPFMAPYLRLLGARVGRRTTIGTSAISLPHLLDIGDDATVGYGVAMRPWRADDGWVVVGGIRIDEQAFVGASAVLEPATSVGEAAALGEKSVLVHGEHVPDGQRWIGSPAKRTNELLPTVEALLTRTERVPGWRMRHLAAASLAGFMLELATLVTTLPSMALVGWSLVNWGPLAALAAVVLAGPVFVLTACVIVAAGKRAVLARAPEGIHPARSGLGLRKWIVDKLLDMSLRLTNPLYATLYTVPWLRMLGARAGKRAEVSTASHLDPDLLDIGEESFVADMASVGTATFARGWMALRPTVVGRRSFVGNSALMPAGARMGEGSLVGVGTVASDGVVPDGTSWLGSPAMHLPRRQDSGAFSEAQTFRPPWTLVAQRLAIEFARATLPATILIAAGVLYLVALAALAAHVDPAVVALVSPLLLTVAGLAVIGYCAAVKHHVVGVYRTRVEPLWSTFVRRTEFVTGLYENAAVAAGLGLLVGTPFLPVLLRWFNVHIGRRCWVGTTYLTEFDLVHIGDDATVGTEVSLQTHLFEDRVMKMSTVTIGDGTSLGTRTIVLYDSVVGDEVSLGSLSLLMKGEQLTDGGCWRGLPAEQAVFTPEQAA
jgi:non-ribosomal peptide synthetase-like protein